MNLNMHNHTLEIVSEVHQHLSKNGLTISVAESCIGGLLSHLLTLLPGSGAFFEAGIVSYSIKAKEEILRVSREPVAKHGGVSGQTAKEMAEKAKALTKTGFSISTTGNLGPDILEGKDGSRIYVAVSSDYGTVTRELKLIGDRENNKEAAALASLELLLEVIRGA